MHTLGARLRARATLTSYGDRGRVRRRCLSFLADGTTARSLPPRPLRRHLGGSGISTNTPSRRNASRECASVAAVTDEAFPRVLNGPAPGYAEDALRTLMLGASADTQQARVPRRANGYRAARAAPDNDLSHNSNGSAESYRENEISQNLSTTTAWSEPESALDAYPANGGGEATARMEASRALDRWAALGEDEADGANDVAGLRAALFPRTDELSARGGAALAEDPPSDDRRQDLLFESWREPRDNTSPRPSPPQQRGTNERTNGGASPAMMTRPWSAATAEAVYGEEDAELLGYGEAIQGGEAKGSRRAPLPPSMLWEMQLEREEQSHQEACDKYAKTLKGMMARGKASHMKPVERLLCTWYPALKQRIEAEQAAVWANEPDEDKANAKKGGAFGGRNTYGPLLVMLKADKQAVLVMHEVVNLILADGNKGVSTLKACMNVAELVQAEVNLLKMKASGKLKTGDRGVQPLPVSSRRHVKALNGKAQDALDSLDYASWPAGAQVKLGAALIRFLLDTACWTQDSDGGGVMAWDKEAPPVGGRGSVGKPRQAFAHNIVHDRRTHRQGMLTLAPEVYTKMVEEGISRLAAPRHVPMLVPPQDWERPNRGGFIRLHSQIMRTKGDRAQKEALKKADLKRVYEGLNCLGKVRWRINCDVLDTVVTCLEEKIPVGDLPTADDLPVPPLPEGVTMNKKGNLVLPKREDYDTEDGFKAALQAMFTYRRTVNKVKTKNANMHSLRCDMKIKVNIAEEFRHHVFYFPYNMDFRGRTYPIPPNLNILGSDFSRGVLMFDESRPLGERGLYWLKVHLANLFGEDKVSFDGRVAFVEKHLDQIRDSASSPLEGKGWWKGADSPWQCLAVCKDLTAALDSPDPTAYISCLPVHQDGSCNGLQHYAALGLDAKGGAQVNLVPSHKPGDVYTGVCDVVKQKVETDLSNVPDPLVATDQELENYRLAKIVKGCIDRKVVKQTVMTSVYGVTFVGARKQIQNVLEERLLSGSGVPTAEDEMDAYKASSYVARHTMNVLEELFTEARNTMEWLMAVSSLVAKEGQSMAWITPLGLPVIQPYRQRNTYQVQTLLQGVHLREERDNVPVSVPRQKSAFPPNFVHSLDSTHMLLTAVEMNRSGMPFAAVHDSYWVHAGNVDHMNWQLRQCFVDLYSGPILEDLYESVQMRYPTIEFPPIPERGSLKLEDVKNSKYFFN